MIKKVWLPDAEQVAEIHRELTTLFAGEEDPISPPGIKSEALLDSACNRPLTGIGSEDKYRSEWGKYAALFHSLVKNHPFHNGNKRTAIVALLTVLYRNHYRFSQDIDDDEIYDLALRVTADRFPTDAEPLSGDKLIATLSGWLSEHTESTSSVFPTIRVSEFLKRCEEAGCTVKTGAKGGRWIVQNHGKGSVSFSQATAEFSGNVTKRYLQKLGLTASASGVLGAEFHEGVSDERAEMHRYMIALRRLAKT